MIIKFIGKKESIARCLQLLHKLPKPCIPLYYSEDEGVIDKEHDKWEDKSRFERFKNENPLGFHLYAASCTFDLDLCNYGYSSLFIEIRRKTSYKYADEIIQLLASISIFGMACMWKEYEFRNQVMKTIGQGDIYSFVGKDLKNSFPGIYWKTLMSKSKIDEFGVNMEMLETTFNEVEEINDGNYILCTAYEDSLDWERNAEKIDEYCANDNAFFSKRKVEKLMESITEREDYMDLLQEYS